MTRPPIALAEVPEMIATPASRASVLLVIAPIVTTPIPVAAFAIKMRRSQGFPPSFAKPSASPASAPAVRASCSALVACAPALRASWSTFGCPRPLSSFPASRLAFDASRLALAASALLLYLAAQRSFSFLLRSSSQRAIWSLPASDGQMRTAPKTCSARSGLPCSVLPVWPPSKRAGSMEFFGPSAFNGIPSHERPSGRKSSCLNRRRNGGAGPALAKRQGKLTLSGEAFDCFAVRQCSMSVK